MPIYSNNADPSRRPKKEKIVKQFVSEPVAKKPVAKKPVAKPKEEKKITLTPKKKEIKEVKEAGADAS